jgi:lipopolysaccharide/colanic/teichoic acid biosynthesis glycosyltransferase
MKKKYGLYSYIKRILDIFFSLLLIILLSPFLLIVLLSSLVFMGPPVLFKQNRIGWNDRIFRIYKFRTMKNKSEQFHNDRLRLNWYGHVLRVLHMDEFPQLFNILIGDMSFIGPRPLLPEYMPYYTATEKRRHEVRPGLSSLSLVAGNYLKWEEQFKYDIHYIDNLSFGLDCRILYETILRLIFPAKKLLRGELNRTSFDLYRSNKA